MRSRLRELEERDFVAATKEATEWDSAQVAASSADVANSGAERLGHGSSRTSMRRPDNPSAGGGGGSPNYDKFVAAKRAREREAAAGGDGQCRYS